MRGLQVLCLLALAALHSATGDESLEERIGEESLEERAGEGLEERVGEESLEERAQVQVTARKTRPSLYNCYVFTCSRWTPWSRCSVTCGKGQRTRTRKCALSSRWKGVGFPKCPISEIQRCYLKYKCPIDGGWGRWGSWGRCSATCGGGKRVRRRQCINPRPQYGGKPCRGLAYQYGSCSTQTCPRTTTTTPITATTPTPTPTPTPTRRPGIDCFKCPNVVNYIGYMANPKDCTKFYVCIFNAVNPKGYKVVSKSCPRGLVWSQEILTCVRPPAASKKCGGKGTPCASGKKYYADLKNCAAYYQCVPGSSTRMCCPPGTRWLQQKSKCGYGKTACRDKCVKDKSTGGCSYDQQFYLPCDDTGPIFPKDHSCQLASVTNVGNVTRYPNGKFGPGCYFNNKKGCKLEVPFFNNWFYGVNTFSAVLWFKPYYVRSSSKYQYLLHNGDCKEASSINMYLWNSGGKWLLRARLNGRLVGSVQVKTYQWVYTALVYNGTEAVLYTWNKSGKQSKVARVQVPGPIRNTHCPLTIGKQGSKYAFSGLMDEIRLFKRTLTSPQVDNLRSKNKV